MILSLPADLLCLALFLAAGAGAGGRLLARFLPPEEEGAPGALLLSLALGLFALSYAAYALGLAGLAYRPVFLGLFAAAALYGRRELASALRSFRRPLPLSRAEKLLLGLLLAAAALNFLYNYAPPAAEDEISTHLGLAAKWAAAHAIYEVPGASSEYFPLGVLSDYLALTSACSVQAARLLHYLAGLLCLASVYLLGRRFLSRAGALLAAALFYTMPACTSLSGVGNTDFLSVFYAILAVHAYLGWLEGGARGRLWLAAALTGAHAACKYTAFPPLLILPLLVLWERRGGAAAAARDAVLFGLAAFSALLPYLARNALLTGNPLFPMRLPGLRYEELLYLIYLQKSPLADFFRMLADFSASGDVIWGVGPVFAAFLPAALFFGLKDGAGRNITARLLWAGGLYCLLLFLAGITMRLTRHGLLAFALLSVPVAHAAGRLLAGRLRGYAAALLAATFGVGLALPAYFGLKRLPVFLGLETRKAYFEKEYDYWEGSAMADYINARVPAGAGLLFLNTVSAPQLNYPRQTAFGMGAFSAEFYGLDGAAAAAELARQGISYLVVVGGSFSADPDGALRWNCGGPGLRVNWLRPGFARPVVAFKGVTLYALAPAPAPEGGRGRRGRYFIP